VYCRILVAEERSKNVMGKSFMLSGYEKDRRDRGKKKIQDKGETVADFG